MPARRRRLNRLGVVSSGIVVGLVIGGASSTALADDVALDGGLQWGLERVRAPEAWPQATGDGVVIAVIDSGVAVDHEDLQGQLVPGVACRNTSGDPEACSGSAQDDDGHGTHVSGIAAAVTGNDQGIAGVAPDARIMPIKVLFRACPDCESSGHPDDVVAAIRWATDHGADVINLSLGSTTESLVGPGFLDAVDAAWSAGSIPVVAAGNDLVRTVDLGSSPAVVVAATGRDDEQPDYSPGVGGARWALAAPGGSGVDSVESCSSGGDPLGILSTYWALDAPTAAYACLSGTSMAAPHVSGALAILLSAGATPDQALTMLAETAVDIGAPGPDPAFGSGLIDIAAALDHFAQGRDHLESTVPSAPPTSAPVVADAAGRPATATPVRQRFVTDPGNSGAPTASGLLEVLAALAVLSVWASLGIVRSRLAQ